MLTRALACAILAVVAGLSGTARSEEAKTFAFDSRDALAGWKITGDAAVDTTKSHDGKGGSLKVGPGGVALLKLRDTDGAGKVELWVYDDCTKPANPKAHRVGPRWGIVGSNGRVLAIGILYADYLGGTEGYTATTCDGKDWFDQLFWLGTNRTPAGWHKWTIDFDAEEGIEILHNGKNVHTIDTGKTRLNGFSSIAIWGDSGKGDEQTVWIADLSVTLGGPVKVVPITEADPYDAKSIAAAMAARRPTVIYTKDNPPATPKLEDLPLKDSVSEFGITWTFDKPARVGQFVNGDWYVVGPATVTAIDPKPLYGKEIKRRQLDHMDLERPEAQRVRNGFMLNPPAEMKMSYDSGIRNWWDPSLIQKLPAAMKPGDSLVATISMAKNLILKAQLRNKIERGDEDSSPIRTAAVLTCVAEPQPPDAFRPSFVGQASRLPAGKMPAPLPIYLARNLKRELLPKVAATKSAPSVDQYIRFTERPWICTGFFGFEEPVENMPQYGQEVGRVSGVAALLLCTDIPAEKREPLLVNYVQIGIDLGGIVRAGHPGWSGWGGHGSGRKTPIIFAGLLLGDEPLANIGKTCPKASFGEDEQTAYGDCWTGAKVVFAGHSGIDTATGAGRVRGSGWGPYEHIPPAQWKAGANTSEAYRRANTSGCWVGEAIAMRLLHAEKAWGHDAFFDYVDRWMFEKDGEIIKTLKDVTGKDYNHEWTRQGFAWDEFAGEMFAKYRATLDAATDGWKQKHDDTYYRNAIELMLKPGAK